MILKYVTIVVQTFRGVMYVQGIKPPSAHKREGPETGLPVLGGVALCATPLDGHTAANVIIHF